MRYRELGNTGLQVSEIGLGGEWLERHSTEEVKDIILHCEKLGINILDCWMSNPKVRSDIGAAIAGRRDRWYIQGHIGSTWQNGQYVRTREIEQVKLAFQDLLDRMQTDYIDLGMIHFIDEYADYKAAFEGEFLEYVKELKKTGKIHHIGLSTHNPVIGKMAAESGIVELILFSINPAFDILPASEDINFMFTPDTYLDMSLQGIAPERKELYAVCEREKVGITVMKGYAGGRLFTAETSPFQVALTPVQCLHYALTRPAVASVMVGVDTVEHVTEACKYEDASMEEKDYATILAKAPYHTYVGQCTYCGHCVPCPVKIDIAMMNKLYDLAVMQSEVPASLRAHYKEMAVNSDACIGCASCESRCPFGVKISERMEKARELFQ